jgi:hypothetical protein
VHQHSKEIRRKLYQLQYKVISSMYEQNLGCGQPLSESQLATEMFKLEQELATWQHCVALPFCIRTHTSLLYDHEVACEERFRVILTLRFLNLQTLLHRPFLTRSLDIRSGRSKNAGSTTSAERLAAGSIQTGLKSAEEIISMVHKIISVGRAHDLLGAWWFSLYYGRSTSVFQNTRPILTHSRTVFGACLTVFATLLISPDIANFDIPFSDRLERGRALLVKGNDALCQLDIGNQVAARCVKYVSEVLSLLDRWRKPGYFHA